MASIWRRLQLLTAGTTPARRFQEEADTGVAAVLMCYRNLRASNTTAENAELFQQAVDIMEKKNYEQQKRFVHDEATIQIKQQFAALIKAETMRPRAAQSLSVSGFGAESDSPSAEEESASKDPLRELLGFSLTVEPSSVPNAGEGVKLNGHLSIGSVVALFPGTVYLPEHFKKPHYLKEISNNVYARARFDSIIIDAKNESSTPRNPLAVAHKINHPPAELGPNVMPFAFDFPPEEPFESPEYQRMIPNSFVEMPSRLAMFGKRALVHGLVFITTAEINDGEELFLNYRYNPNNPFPDWYTPVDLESDREMWK
ncbi:hypothetical protein PINS_up000172 [Pythium insidiosum]|nr:hypothetical protein PINS_up000172 [Pythium insidiosum]